jgi:hypothetical protein
MITMIYPVKVMIMYKCAVCNKPVNIKRNHVTYHDENGKKCYEHIECANLLPIEQGCRCGDPI